MLIKVLLQRRSLHNAFLKRNFSHLIKKQNVSINGQTINYIKVGEGAKSVLCFPGALGTIWSDFKPQILGLDRNKFTIIAWDPPGYGYSRPPDRKFCPEFYENDADAAFNFMKHLNIEKYSLLGWSDGGIASLILAAKYPDAVDKLIVWGANSYIVSEDIQAYEAIRDISNWSERMKAPLVALYTETGLQTMWNGWCDALKEIHERGGDICSKSLSRIKSPTLILHGDLDPMIASEHPLHLLANIEGSKLHTFPQGKHNIHLKYAEDFNKIVTDFILNS